jgi:hypothetical protein
MFECSNKSMKKKEEKLDCRLTFELEASHIFS